MQALSGCAAVPKHTQVLRYVFPIVRSKTIYWTGTDSRAIPSSWTEVPEDNQGEGK